LLLNNTSYSVEPVSSDFNDLDIYNKRKRTIKQMVRVDLSSEVYLGCLIVCSPLEPE